MAKISIKQRELKRARLIARYSETRKKLKKALLAMDMSHPDWDKTQKKLKKLPNNSSPVRAQRRCTSCGRPRAVYRKFKLCRICMREAVMYGFAPGVGKSSW